MVFGFDAIPPNPPRRTSTRPHPIAVSVSSRCGRTKKCEPDLGVRARMGRTHPLGGLESSPKSKGNDPRVRGETRFAGAGLRGTCGSGVVESVLGLLIRGLER